MILGKKVYLTAVEKKDLPQLMIWRNKEELRQNFREYREINEDMQNKWFEEKVLNDFSTIMFSIKRISDDRLLGCCGLCNINWIHRYSELSLYIGWNSYYIDNEGYAEESCSLLIDYGFNKLALNKIWVEIYEFDTKKAELCKKLGFELDGVFREHYFYNGKWWDSKIMSILAKDYFNNSKNSDILV